MAVPTAPPSSGSLQSLCLGKLSKNKEGAPEVQPVFIHPVHDPLKNILCPHSQNLNTERNEKAEGRHVWLKLLNAQGVPLKLAIGPL